LAFPTSIESAEYFGVAYNNLSTTLTQQCSASDTTIYVASTDNFPSSGWVTIEDEVIYYTGKTSGSFTNCTRGADNTVAAIHQSSKTVSLTYTAAMHNRIVTELRATQTKLGDNNTFLVTPSSAPTSDYQVANKKYIDDQATATLTLTNKTLISPVINSPTFTKTIQTIVTATDGATVTFNLSLGNIQQVTLGGNRTLAVSNVSVGQCFILNLIQDATGGRTVTWFAGISWAGGSAPTLTTTANKRDSFGFICTAANTYLGYIVGLNL